MKAGTTENALNGARKWVNSLHFYAASAIAVLFSLLGGPQPRRILLISDGPLRRRGQQFAPFARFAGPLRRKLGVTTHSIHLKRGLKLSSKQLFRYDIVGLDFSFCSSQQSSLEAVHHFRRMIDRSKTRLFYFDDADNVNVQRPDLLVLVDQYVKKHAYRDRSAYAVAPVERGNLTDYVARVHDHSSATNEMQDTLPFDTVLLNRIVVGWDINIVENTVALARRSRVPSGSRRQFDVCSRYVATSGSHTFHMCDLLVRMLGSISCHFKVLIPTKDISEGDYRAELSSSTIFVSPFGSDEICRSDFEAILLGCLLIKADMRHIETAVDVFMPGDTYVPVRWDYADLAGECAYYLEEKEERRQLVERAYSTLLDIQTADWFVNRLRTLIA